jgi:hypothetical protein
MSNVEDFSKQPDEIRQHDVDFDVVLIDLSWPESFGNLVYRGNDSMRGATWEDGLDIHFAQVQYVNSSHSKPGAGEESGIPIPIATEMKRAGPKTDSKGVVHARLIARPALWSATLAARIVTRSDWAWDAVPPGQRIEFHVPEHMQLNVDRRKKADVGWIKPDLTSPAPPPHRGKFVFKAVLF